MSDSVVPFDKTPGFDRVRQYLINRGFPVDDEYLRGRGLEIAGPQRIKEVVGCTVRGVGLLIKYPGCDYAIVRLMDGGPRCPKGVRPHAYLTPETDWGTVEGTIVLCESALKALTWSRHGYQALAAGGVTTVHSKGEWCVGFPSSAIRSGAVDRLIIGWDSDIEHNHNVVAALRRLCRQLRLEFPELSVEILPLPQPPEELGKKSWGVDDAYKFYGPEWFLEWAECRELRELPSRDEYQDHMDELDDKYVYCESEARVLRVRDGLMWTAATWAQEIEPWRLVPGEKRPIPVARDWLRRQDRPMVERLGYHPGGDQLVGREYNLWKPSPIKPVAGSVERWLDLLNDAVKDQEVRRLLIQCMAYQVQHRDKQLQKLLFFVGREVGTGKSTQAEIMKKILGSHNTGWVTRDSLESSFNSSWAGKELVVFDDVQILKKDMWSKLKSHLTSEEVEIKEKYREPRLQTNYATYYVTANSADVIATDASERRVLLIPFEPSVLHRESNDPYWREFHGWLNKGGGIQAIAHYLLTLDLGDFNPDFVGYFYS